MEHKLTTEKILAAADKCEAAKEVLKELFPEAFKKKNVVTQFPDEDNKRLLINGEWAASIYPVEEQGTERSISKQLSGRAASIFLARGRGTWYNEQGNQISGYLFYEPK